MGKKRKAGWGMLTRQEKEMGLVGRIGSSLVITTPTFVVSGYYAKQPLQVG